MTGKELPTLGTEINKQLKALVQDVVENDQEVRDVIKSMVLESIRSNPKTIRIVIENAMNEATKQRWNPDRNGLAIEMQVAINQVAEQVMSHVRAAANAEIIRQLNFLKEYAPTTEADPVLPGRH